MSDLERKTKEKYFIDGDYIEERKALHEVIINKILKETERKDLPEAFLLGGGAASGKSTVRDEIILAEHDEKEDFTNIDSDEIKKYIPEFSKILLIDMDKAAVIVHDESSDIAEKILNQCIERKQHLIYDGTMKNLEKYEALIKELRQNGYKINGVMVNLPLDLAIERAEIRASIENRVVPLSIIKESHMEVPDTFYKIKEQLDNYAVYDNSGEFPELVAFKEKNDKEEMVIDKEKYAEFFLKANINIFE
ncbi:zeta toxin family protein [Priestia megaterium]|uniref:zeta toxin family protein n=1 Tax=Priestia megaterium TaxID=1404 RepID=UPI0039FCDAE9